MKPQRRVQIDPAILEEIATSPTFARFRVLVDSTPPKPRTMQYIEPPPSTFEPFEQNEEVVNYEAEHISADQLPGYKAEDWD